MHNALEKVVRF